MNRYPTDYGYGATLAEWVTTVAAWLSIAAVVFGPALLLAWWLR